MIASQIRARGVRDERVLAALAGVPRHAFVPEADLRSAYDDRPLPIGERQTISQPYMVAAMTEILSPAGDARVLEVGTGSGYQTAVLASLAAEVLTIERIAALGARARAALERLGYRNVRYRIGDGSLGWPEYAPFDGILVTAATPAIPPPLLDQLAEGGILVAPVGERGGQDLVSVRRERGLDRRTVHFGCTFVPLLGAAGFAED